MLDLAIRCRRAHYRAWRRGTREMDLLLGRFASARLAPARPDEAWLLSFEALLDENDGNIYDWLIDLHYAGKYKIILQEIRAFHGTLTK